jgi:MFS family permease
MLVFISTIFYLLVFTIILGCGYSLWLINIQVYIRENVPNKLRGRALSIIGGILRFSLFLGPIIGGYMGKYMDFRYVFVFQSFIFMVGFFLICLFFPRSRNTQNAKTDTTPPFKYRVTNKKCKKTKNSNIVLMYCNILYENKKLFFSMGLVIIILSFLRGSRQMLIPLWGENINLDSGDIGLIIGLSSVIGMTLFFPAGIIMDRFGRKWGAFPCILGLTLGLGLIPFSTNFGGLLALSIIAETSNGLGSGLVMIFGTDFAPDNSTSEFLGIWRLISDIGKSLGPLFIGIISQLLSLRFSSPFLFIFGILAIYILLFKTSHLSKYIK